MTVTAQSQDIIVNVINDTLVTHYEVDKQVIYTTKNKSYRVYVMVRIGKDHVANIVSEIKQMKLAQTIDTTDIDAAADKVLKN
jgi:IS30 family transposase